MPSTTKWCRSAGCTSWPPSGTNRGASITSFADDPGRQGDPGSSRFFLSLQDDLLRIFGGERMQNLMLRLGMEEDVPIESKLITKRIAKAQEAVEMQNFEARKHLLEYDDVNNKQRQAVYGMRRKLLEGADQKEHVMDMVRASSTSSSTCAAPTTSTPIPGT
jgi:preprotein translocase subunit SecA